jgi:hypothetical protein
VDSIVDDKPSIIAIQCVLSHTKGNPYSGLVENGLKPHQFRQIHGNGRIGIECGKIGCHDRICPSLFLIFRKDSEPIWIEKELARESLPEAKKTALQDLKGKALNGTLRRSELRAYKSKANNKIADGNRAFLAKLRSLRTYGASLAGLPEGVIAHLQAAIDLFKPEVADVKQKALKKGAKRPTAVS